MHLRSTANNYSIDFQHVCDINTIEILQYYDNKIPFSSLTNQLHHRLCLQFVVLSIHEQDRLECVVEIETMDKMMEDTFLKILHDSHHNDKYLRVLLLQPKIRIHGQM